MSFGNSKRASSPLFVEGEVLSNFRHRPDIIKNEHGDPIMDYEKPPSRLAAVVLSLFLPGVGSIYAHGGKYYIRNIFACLLTWALILSIILSWVGMILAVVLVVRAFIIARNRQALIQRHNNSISRYYRSTPFASEFLTCEP